MMAIFFMDLVLHFFVAYYDQELLVTDRKLIASRYIKCAPLPHPHPGFVNCSWWSPQPCFT